MPHYRLVADHGHVAATLTADDDQAAEDAARELSVDTATSKTTAYRLERQDAEAWVTSSAWMPRRIWSDPAARDALVFPADPEG